MPTCDTESTREVDESRQRANAHPCDLASPSNNSRSNTKSVTSENINRSIRWAGRTTNVRLSANPLKPGRTWESDLNSKKSMRSANRKSALGSSRVDPGLSLEQAL